MSCRLQHISHLCLLQCLCEIWRFQQWNRFYPWALSVWTQEVKSAKAKRIRFQCQTAAAFLPSSEQRCFFNAHKKSNHAPAAATFLSFPGQNCTKSRALPLHRLCTNSARAGPCSTPRTDAAIFQWKVEPAAPKSRYLGLKCWRNCFPLIHPRSNEKGRDYVW